MARRGYSVSKRLVKLTRFKISPYSCLNIKIYLRYHLCCDINFNTLVVCSSVQLTYSKFCKTSINLQPAKQGLLSLIPEAVVHMNFAVNFARFFSTLILYSIGNHIQNRCFKKSRKIHGSKYLLNELFLLILCWNFKSSVFCS